MLSPQTKRYLYRSIPFFSVWIFFGLIYIAIEYGILGNSTHYPSTNNAYNLRNNLLYVFPACFLMGLLQAYSELHLFKSRFSKIALWLKILLKLVIYMAVIILFILLLSVINALDIYDDGLFSKNVKNDILSFVNDFAFWSVILYTGFGAFIALLISEMSSYLGNGVFYSFLFGRYHQPNEEMRIFMFLDMKSSTTIAEKLGHKAYFNLIKQYYSDMTDAIIKTKGEVYQYVGDEIVITWLKQNGLENNNCVECFFAIEGAITQMKSFYLEKYNLIPEFKAGIHMGHVTTGEIGILKKDIIYTGDVLNTTARIQSLCNTYDSKIIVSERLKNSLKNNGSINFKKIEDLTLRGKTSSISLYSLKKA